MLNLVPNPRKSITGKTNLLFAERDTVVACRLEEFANRKRTIKTQKIINDVYRVRHSREVDVGPPFLLVAQTTEAYNVPVCHKLDKC